MVVEIEQSSDEEDQDWAEEFNDEFDDSDGMDVTGDGLSDILPSRSSFKRKAAAALAKEQQAAKRAKKALPAFLKGLSFLSILVATYSTRSLRLWCRQEQKHRGQKVYS